MEQFVLTKKIKLFWTGNVKAENNLAKCHTSYVLTTNFDDNKIGFKKVLFQVNHTKYTRHFRDPKPIKIYNKIYLLLAAQKLNLTQALVIYLFDPKNDQAKFLGEVNFSDSSFMVNSFMFECPDFFQIENQDVIVLATQGHDYFGINNQTRDNNIFLIGKMDWNKLYFDVKKIQIIDIGYDFYAAQIFSNTNKLIMLAWAGKPETEVIATWKNMWAHSLTWPRILSWKNNQIYQQPHPNFVQLKKNLKQEIQLNQKLKTRLNWFFLYPIKQNFNFELCEFKNLKNKIIFNYQNQILTVNKSQMNYEQAKHFGEQWTRKIDFINDLEIILDNSLIEIYINQGQYVFSLKYFLKNKLLILIKNIKGHFYELNPIQIYWNDQKKILLPGEALIDVFYEKNDVNKQVGGAPLNVAVGLKKWNHKPYFMGCIGNDDHGKVIKKTFKKFKLPLNYLQIINYSTTVAQVNLKLNGERDFKFLRSADAKLLLPNLIIDYDVLILSSATAFLGDQLLDTYLKLTADAIKKNKLIVFDPNFRFDLYKNQIENWINLSKKFINQANIVKLSNEELDLIFPKKTFLDQIKLLQALKPQIFLITLGSKGTMIITKNNNCLIKSIIIKQIDTTGAGDAFLGAFIGQFISMKNFNIKIINLEQIKSCVFWANISAALTCTKKGAATSIPELIKLQKKYNQWIIKNN